ncbi:SigE family RNA polymerase sigma factor [Calidifontibacter sp. DB0510]|uniref:SigE family RNA polymerase sigma factor n=1 Tax=Metallococcus carri TaxID=1656884 RepID=A0A967B2E0_9MICO|nr:SigE family RNA polymerase sigma factor [Metallococcus carri]NHN56752.1 SigE family RNA polymerase sigma factor [Metallococcus carri]NOP37871.1 SigE family RNA polymerase sigma factor [Calidifontibacter sp. DB2511S]
MSTHTLRHGRRADTTVSSQVDLAELYREHQLPMVRLARLLVDDLASAEDVVQDAFLGLHRNAGGLRDPQAALGYLRRSVINNARSALRHRRTVRAHLKVAEPDLGPPADAPVLLAEEHSQVLQAVRALPPRQREVLVLRYWSELTEAQIADALGIRPGTVKSQASRALDALARVLEEQV